MKENHTQLYPNEQVAQNVGAYSYQHSSKLPQHLLDYHKSVVENNDLATMMVSPLQAQFLVWIARAFKVNRVLEIGCFVGFSSLLWSHAIGEQGHITTLEYDPEYAKMAAEIFSKTGAKKNIDLVIGDASDSIKHLSSSIKEPFDLVFIDADKESYARYASLILSLSSPSSPGTRLVRAGGLIVADNVLSGGLVADSSDANPLSDRSVPENAELWNDEELQELDKFNKLMVDEQRVDVFMLPVFDGLSLGVLKD